MAECQKTELPTFSNAEYILNSGLTQTEILENKPNKQMKFILNKENEEKIATLCNKKNSHQQFHNFL